MEYTLHNLISDVVTEANNLRQYATAEERAKLLKEKIESDDPNKCIYGLLTGHCFSDRAAELIDKCATAFFFDIDVDPETKPGCFVTVKKPVRFRQEREGMWNVPFSAIELYIHQYPEMALTVAEFIAEKTYRLILKQQ